jgi:hypothetical protein
MITVKCYGCGKTLMRSPSKVHPRNFCNRSCYADIRDKEIIIKGINTRLTGKENFKKTFPINEKHQGWKGDNVGYRGLHMWLKRRLGKPTKCYKCGKEDARPRYIQWANIDGQYSRVLSDYVPMCVSCHKYHDIELKANQVAQVSI